MNEAKNLATVAKSGGKFQKGQVKIGGRKKGTPNKLTVDVKQVAFDIFKELGGMNGAAEFFKKNSVTKAQFYNLFFKMLPSNLKVSQDDNFVFEITYNGNNGNNNNKPKKESADQPTS